MTHLRRWPEGEATEAWAVLSPSGESADMLTASSEGCPPDPYTDRWITRARTRV